MYQQNTSLGKRSRGTQDFPQAKRLHETAPDFTLFPSFDTSSSWTLDTQPTPPGSIDFGLPDEAAEMCAMWFNKYNVLPSDKHIESLSTLTGESTDAIRSWFGRLLKQGMGGSQGDSAYKSQTGLIGQQDSFWDNQFSNDTLQASPIDLLVQQPEITTTPAAPCTHEHTTTVLPATALRGSKKRCSPTDDQQLLARDPNKIYQCTRKCGKRYGRKCDWKRNEEEGYPCKSWVCSLCKSDGVENVKPCFRKYHFVQHFRNIHPDLNADEYEEASVVSSDTEFPRQCGFCRHRFTSRQDRIDHIADHFKQGKCMLDWNEEDMSDSDGSSDDNNDDDDSGDGGSDSGSKPSYPPPQYDPSGDAGSKYYSGGGSGSGSGGDPPQGGFFQFQLSQLHEGGGIEHQPIIEQHIKSAGDNFQQQVQSFSELGQQSLLLEQHSSSTRDNTGVVAGDDVSMLTAMEDLQHPGVVIPNDCVDHDPQQTRSTLENCGSNHQDAESGSCVLTVETNADRLQVSQSSMTSSSVLSQVYDLKQTSQAVAKNANSASTKIDKRRILPQLLQNVPTTSQSFLSVKLLGAGGFSTVDEVVHRDTMLRVGRKTLKNRDQTAVEELRKEVSILQKLRHPHIIRFLGAYAKGDKMSILLSPVAETTLALWLEQSAVQKPVNLAEIVISMFGCLVSSVRYLHEQRPIVKHLDIKPQNILIVENGTEVPHVVLTDFGVSTSEDSSNGQAGPITRQYVAPEVFIDFTRKEAADIWSLGCVFAEMASVPFSQDNTGWTMFRKQYSGRQSKNYWQDTAGVQDSLTVCLDAATSVSEQTVVRTIKAMLNAQPTERPSAAALTLVFTPAPCCLNWSNDKLAFPGPHEELDRVEMCVHKDHVDCPVQSTVHNQNDQPLAKQTSTLTSWLDDCLNEHEACRHVAAARDLRALPTRLLDICPDDGPDSTSRLVDSESLDSSIDSVKYIALSHVPGQGEIALSSETLSMMSNGVSLQTIPEKICRAISLARVLGYRYIWVDTLCVIQDSEADRKQECRAMASVFRNADLTINLDQTVSDASGEKFVSARATEDSRTSVDVFATRHPSSAPLSSIDFNKPGFGWNTHLWVLQERLLSHRFLHLGEQIYWECNSLKASETFPYGLSPLVWEKVHSTSSKIAKISVDRSFGTKHGLINSKIAGPARVTVPCKLRDCQWIRRQGESIGDNMIATQTTLQLEGVKTSSVNPCTCRNRAQLATQQGDLGLADDSVSDLHPNVRRLPPDNDSRDRLDAAVPVIVVVDDTPTSSTTTSSSSSSTSTHLPEEKCGRKDICASGQCDQHGLALMQGVMHAEECDESVIDGTG